jgi:hypothetical protein
VRDASNTVERDRRSLIVALMVHVFLLPYWFAVGFVWGGTPTRFELVLVYIYVLAAALGWPTVVIALIIWWRQGRDHLARRAILAAATAAFPFALALLLFGRVRRAVVPPRIGTSN